MAADERVPTVVVDHVDIHYRIFGTGEHRAAQQDREGRRGALARAGHRAIGGGQDLVHAVRDVSLVAHRGESIGLIGRNGSGKSTLVNLLLRFYDPASGRVLVDGQPITEVSMYSLRQASGLVSQDVYLFEGSIRDNIAYGMPDADEAAIIEAAKTAEAWSFIETLPQGLDTPVGERGVRLSGGQRQRLSLARALLKNPPILVLDEATSALDVTVQARVLETIDDVLTRVGAACLFISHDLAVVSQVCDEVVVMHQGTVMLDSMRSARASR